MPRLILFEDLVMNLARYLQSQFKTTGSSTLGSSFTGFPRPSGQVSCYDKTHLKDSLPRRHVHPNPDMDRYAL